MVIDAHTHYGIAYKGGKMFDMEVYTKFAKKYNVTQAIMMITPMPLSVVSLKSFIEQYLTMFTEPKQKEILKQAEDNIPHISYIHYIRDNKSNKIKHYHGVKINNEFILDKLNFDPYFLPNKYFFEVAKASHLIKPILSIHPLFFTKEQYFDYLKDSIGYKIHGIATCTSPELISNEIIDFLKEENKPLVVHTEYDETPPKYKRKLFKENSTMKWVNFAIENDLKLYLTHGARLSHDAIATVNKSHNIYIGIGPDYILSRTTGRMERIINGKIDYLEYLCKNTRLDRICFDTDFPWNVDSSGDNFDFKTIEVLSNIIRHGPSLEMVLGENASNLFNLM